ncbi:MAG: GNAT family protein [Gaiellales bacterium]
MQIVSERLRLRPFELADAPVFSAYRSDPDVARYQSWNTPYTLSDARAFVGEMRTVDERQPGWYQWAIERLDEPGLIGDVGVNLLDDRIQAMLGYTLAPHFQRQGYAREAIGRMLDHLFVERGLRRVGAECDPRNEASVRLLERLGFWREGHLRASTWSKGEWTDDVVYRLLAEEWRAGRG